MWNLETLKNTERNFIVFLEINIKQMEQMLPLLNDPEN